METDAQSALAELILQQISDAVIYSDPNGVIRRWNRGAELLFGHRADEALGQNMDLIIPENLRASHWKGFDAAMKSGALRLNGRPTLTRALHSSGRKLYVEMSFALVVDGDNRVLLRSSSPRRDRKGGARKSSSAWAQRRRVKREADDDRPALITNVSQNGSAPSKKRSVMTVPIRKETAADIKAIERVTVEAFRDAPHTSHTEQFIVAALRKAGKLAVSLVAEDAGTVVGHLALSPVSISDGSEGWYGLGPISVAPKYQGRGIGSHLMREALHELRCLGASGCVLVGEPRYYGRFGFEATSSLVLPDVPPEYFQALHFTQARPCGVVTFNEAFNADR